MQYILGHTGTSDAYNPQIIPNEKTVNQLKYDKQPFFTAQRLDYHTFTHNVW